MTVLWYSLLYSVGVVMSVCVATVEPTFSFPFAMSRCVVLLFSFLLLWLHCLYIPPSVPPPDPEDFAAMVTEHHAELRWELPITHPDEDVQSFQLEVTFPNGSRATLMTLDGSARSVVIGVYPGVSYEAHLIARNTDGLGESKIPFSTPPAGELIIKFSVTQTT